jgi:hypothetical protein
LSRILLFLQCLRALSPEACDRRSLVRWATCFAARRLWIVDFAASSRLWKVIHHPNAGTAWCDSFDRQVRVSKPPNVGRRDWTQEGLDLRSSKSTRGKQCYHVLNESKNAGKCRRSPSCAARMASGRLASGWSPGSTRQNSPRARIWRLSPVGNAMGRRTKPMFTGPSRNTVGRSSIGNSRAFRSSSGQRAGSC